MALTHQPAPSSQVARLVAPPRWSSSTLITPTSKNSFGARPKKRRRHACCATPASTWTSMVQMHSACSIRTPTTRCVSPTTSCTQYVTTKNGRTVQSLTELLCAPCKHATCGVRLLKLHGIVPTPVCSSTPRSTSGTPRMRAAALTDRTHVANTCTSITRRATWLQSTC